MGKVQLRIPKEVLNDLKDVWELNQKTLTKEFLEELKWSSMEDFVIDVLTFGFYKAGEDPVSFVRGLREKKKPIFRELAEGYAKGGERQEEEYKKAYI
jgi:hypothetical protein